MAVAVGRLAAVVRQPGGRIAVNTLVNVYAAGTTTASTLYSASDGVTVVGNPVTTDSTGQFAVWAAPGVYDLAGPSGSSISHRGLTVAPTTGGDLTIVGNLTLSTAGDGVLIKEGTNARLGTGTLNGTTEVTIATTAVTATSRIFLTVQTPHGTPAGAIYVSSRSAGVSFGVKGIALDTSDFAWLIIEPA